MPRTPCRLALLLLACMLVGACGSSGASHLESTAIPLPPIEVFAPAMAVAEGTVNDDGGVFDMPPTLTIGDTATDHRSVGILAFDLTGVPAAVQAELTFHRAANLGDPMSLQPLALEHIEGSGLLSMNDLSSPPLGPTVHTLVDQASWSVDVSAQVAADLAAGRTVSTFRFAFEAATNGDGVADRYRIANSKHANALLQPTLVLLVPAP